LFFSSSLGCGSVIIYLVISELVDMDRDLGNDS
jgi:hypothetical protein